MNNLLLVSILVPIYNVENYLAKCLSSIFNQTYSKIEYVFVDDCSSDNSRQVLYDFLSDYKIPNDIYIIISHSKNEGIAVTRADCLANANGDYIYFVDSDDWIEPNAIEQMVRETKDGEIDIVGCDFSTDYISGESIYHRENYAKSCHDNLIKCLNYEIATVLWKLLIRRSLFENFTITPFLNIGEDYIISIKLYYYANSFAALHQSFYHYIQYNTERLSNQYLRCITDHISCVKEVEAFCREKGIYNTEFERLLNLRKFNIKSNFLTKQLLDYNAYIETFPEANRMWREMGYSLNERIKFWLAEHNLYSLLKLIQK